MANTKTVIKQYTAAAVSEVLHREIPDLKISSITIIETGWDHLVAEINGEWIFRFPRTEGSIANMEREKRLLEYLKNHITLPIPHYQYFGTNTAFVGYRKIPGIHLDPQIYAGLNPAIRRSVAETVALFLTELRHAVSKAQALQWGYGYIIRPISEIESSLLGTLPADIATMTQQAIAQAKKDLTTEQNLVFCHQDVNGDNTAFNPVTGQITGVFDFSDAGVGPYSWDFAELFNIDAELARLTAEIYAQKNSVLNPLAGGAADYILRKTTLMLEARKRGNEQGEMILLNGLSDFMPVWHDVLIHTRRISI
jgi:aminoglycoside phosphotransferase (APT) family kinase protein